MNKFIIIIAVSFYCQSVFCQEKKEQPNNYPYKFNMGLGFGYSSFKVIYNDPFTGEKTTLTQNPGLVAKLHVDYSFVKIFSAGLSFESNLGTFDASTRRQFAISFKYKFISKYKNHLFLEILPVYSYFTYYNHNDNPEDDIITKGYGFQAALGWDHFFDKHFGFSIRSAYSSVKYPSKMKYFQNNIGYTKDLSLEYTDFIACMGFLFRF